MADAWASHLQALGLTDLEALAQSVSYRVRAANRYQFDLEYTGGLARYQRPGMRLRTFTSVEDAIAYLTQVKREIEEQPETLAKMQRPRGYQDCADTAASAQSCGMACGILYLSWSRE